MVLLECFQVKVFHITTTGLKFLTSIYSRTNKLNGKQIKQYSVFFQEYPCLRVYFLLELVLLVPSHEELPSE